MTIFEPQLADRFTVETISPFGVMVRPRTAGDDLTTVPVDTARELARQHHLLVLRNFRPPESAEDLARYAGSWGELYTWPFGTVLELIEHDQPSDTVFDHTRLVYHWDGMFVDKIPEFQIFQCVIPPTGGRTIFADTTLIVANAPAETRELWEGLELRYGIRKLAHYGGDVVSPLVVPHPGHGTPTMRFHEPVTGDEHYINPPDVRFPDHLGAERIAEISDDLRAALYDDRHMYAHEWQQGDIVVSDNYTNLHGREAYTSRCGRHLRRVHVLGDPPLANPALPD
ncbi:MAG: TauD/TfdA dioxygenase family protein [Micromonosporaceae bacterium]